MSSDEPSCIGYISKIEAGVSPRIERAGVPRVQSSTFLGGTRVIPARANTRIPAPVLNWRKVVTDRWIAHFAPAGVVIIAQRERLEVALEAGYTLHTPGFWIGCCCFIHELTGKGPYAYNA